MTAARTLASIVIGDGVRPLQAVLLGALLALSGAAPAHAQTAAALQARHGELRAQLAHSPFQRPLHIESRQVEHDLEGDVYARMDQPFATVAAALHDVDHWCDILILHLNIKACRSSRSAAGTQLSLNIGRKREQALSAAHLLEFSYQVVAARPDYLHLTLEAAKGPFGTGRHRVVLEVAALDDQRSFLHLAYASAYGLPARLATQGYLATAGRNKVGFSIVGRRSDGEPLYQGGLRGMVERNAMRYYLAIDAYLGALSTPAPQRLEKRLNDWYAGTERYPLQLHELGRGEYLAMKHKEICRQQSLSPHSTVH